jgi:triacylglycerol lipase
VRSLALAALLVALTAPLAGCKKGGSGGATPARHPFVLAHGALGMQSYGPLDYWFDIVPAMQAEGAQVFVTEVSALHDSYTRGAQLLAQVEEILAITGKTKVHLIGHSQGGLDARYVAGMRPDLVASVTTIGTPHRGAGVAGFLADGILADGSFAAPIVTFFGGLLEDVIQLLTGTPHPLDADAALDGLAPAAAATFNLAFPNGLASGCAPGPAQADGVRFYSWTGDVSTSNALDPTDSAFGVTGLFYLLEPSDGLVSVCSALFGQVIGSDFDMNHLDEVNQMVGLVGPLEVNPRTLFRDHVARLRSLGL